MKSKSVVMFRSDPPEVDEMPGCSLCSHQTASVFQLNHHIQRKHKNVYAAELFHAIVEPEQFPCIYCEFKSYFHFELYEHFQQAHKHPSGTENNEYKASFCEEFMKYQCEYCRYESDSNLSIMKHHDLCAKLPQNLKEIGGMKRKPNLKTNVLQHVTEDGIIWYLCSHCSYGAKCKEDLKRHMLKYAIDKDKVMNEVMNWSQCIHCSYPTKDKPGLKKHILQHATEKSVNWFQCSDCSYRGKRKRDLKMHMLKHVRS